MEDARKSLYAERSTPFMIFDSDSAYFDFVKKQEMSRLERQPGGEVLKPMSMKGALAHVSGVKFVAQSNFHAMSYLLLYLSACTDSFRRT